MLPRFNTCILLITCLHCILSSTATKLTFHDNKYENLVIAIHPNVKEDPQILMEIQRMLDIGSDYLYNATKKTAYLGSAKILVPETWTYNPSWQLATTETFKDADIRVDKPHVSHGTDPYTFQPGLCGEPGTYIHFTPEFLTMSESERDRNYGDIGRAWVHEFAHLRYGVFNEYGLGTEENPYLYLDGQSLFPTGCVKTIQKGYYLGDCAIHNNKIKNSCFFIPDRSANTAKASIMYATTLDKVTAFCESNSNDPDYRHNALAKNQQNKICDGQGTWDVIKKHADFKNGNSPNVPDSALHPTVQILQTKRTSKDNSTQACGRPLVLVLDFSSTMKGARMFRQLQTVDKLVMDALATGTKVGIVTFSTSAYPRVPLTSLATEADRCMVMTTLRAAYQNQKTGIGGGLIKAKQMLADAGELEEGSILLITDGKENVKPKVAEVKNDILRTGIRVHTLAYSSDADLAIGRLSRESGGYGRNARICSTVQYPSSHHMGIYWYFAQDSLHAVHPEIQLEKLAQTVYKEL